MFRSNKIKFVIVNKKNLTSYITQKSNQIKSNWQFCPNFMCAMHIECYLFDAQSFCLIQGSNQSLIGKHFSYNVDSSLGFGEQPVVVDTNEEYSHYDIYISAFTHLGFVPKTLCVTSFLLSIFELCFDSTRACMGTCFACDFQQLGNRCQTHYFPSQSCNLTHRYFNFKNQGCLYMRVHSIQILTVPPSSLYLQA